MSQNSLLLEGGVLEAVVATSLVALLVLPALVEHHETSCQEYDYTSGQVDRVSTDVTGSVAGKVGPGRDLSVDGGSQSFAGDVEHE